MRQADFRSATSRLCDAMNQLEQAWAATKEHWSDGVSQHVEDEFLLPLSGEVRAMTDTVEKLSGVMSKAERACSHPREIGEFL